MMSESSEEGSEIDVESDNQSETNLHPYVSKWHVAKLVDGLNRFRENETFCDVVLVINHRRFPIHRHVLAAASDYFHIMFEGNFKEKNEKEIVLNGISEDIFSLVLNFMYTGNIAISEDTFEEVFRAGSMYLLVDLNKICEEFGELYMNNNNCVARFKIAEELNNNILAEAACSYVKNHFSELIDSTELMYAPMELIIQALKCDELEIRCEEQACEFVLRYIEKNWIDLIQKDSIVSLFKALCLDNLDSAYIKTSMIDNEYIKTNEKLSKYLIGVHDHLAYNTPLPDSYIYPNIRLLTVPTRGLFLFGGKPSVQDDNNCQFISYAVYQNDPGPLELQIAGDTKMISRNVTTIPTGKCEFAASCSIRGDIYISGIGPKLNEMWKFVSPLNQWLRCTGMISSRCRHVMVYTTPNLIYVLGGAIGYDLADKNGEGGDSFNNYIEEYNVSTGFWTEKGMISKSILHPCAVHWAGYIYIIGGALKRGRDFTKTIQRYDPKTETTVILSVALPASVHCPKAVIIGRTVAVVGFHNSVAINMDSLTAVHTVNMEENRSSGCGTSSESNCNNPMQVCQDDEAEEKSLDILDTAAECMTVRKGTKVAWFGLQLFGRDLVVIGGQNTENKTECSIKALDIDVFLNQMTDCDDWKKVGVLQQRQRFCTVTGEGVFAQDL